MNGNERKYCIDCTKHKPLKIIDNEFGTILRTCNPRFPYFKKVLSCGGCVNPDAYVPISQPTPTETQKLDTALADGN